MYMHVWLKCSFNIHRMSAEIFAGIGIFKYYLCLSTKGIHKLVKYDLRLKGSYRGKVDLR